MAKRRRKLIDETQTESSFCGFRLLQTEAFVSPRQPAQFLMIALATNFLYMAALHFLPASLNTAIFCTSPVFTLLLSAVFLHGPADRSSGRMALYTRQALSVALSVVGVILIAEPWHAVGNSLNNGLLDTRLVGASLSLCAALGTAVYQVYFKATFGDRMQPEEVGLFLANMGMLASLLYGMVGLGFLFSGIYPLQLRSVPWGLVLSTAMSSAVFNFLIKFGLSRDSPVALSLATQIGIPLNLLLDVVVVHASVQRTQVLGTFAMLVSFTLFQGSASNATSSIVDLDSLHENRVNLLDSPGL